MSVRELEKRVRTLNSRQLKSFSQWFDDFRGSYADARVDEELSKAQRNEILRRRAEFQANPEIAETWTGTTEMILKHLHARRAKKVTRSSR